MAKDPSSRHASGDSRTVDLRPVKVKALEDFPPGHPYREALLQAPDLIPRGEAPDRIMALVRVLLAARHVSWPGAPAVEA